jgi:predicted MPP superfamily phosphohydrolase
VLWRTTLVALALAGLSLAIWSIAVEPGRLVVRRYPVEVRAWPPALSGWTIVALSDIHAGSPHVDRAALRRVVAVANEQDADLVVLLGDYVIQRVTGGRFIPPEETARMLSGLRARRGVVSVLGNHDWWFDGLRVRRAFEEAGLRPLENEAVRLTDGAAVVWVAGLADLWTRKPDLEAALGLVPAGQPVLLLTHSPDVFPDVPAGVTITLAGHTHGGQVALPLLGPPIVPSAYGQRYAAGLVEERARLLFITPGIGTSIIPVRFRVPPEVSVLTLSPTRRAER